MTTVTKSITSSYTDLEIDAGEVFIQVKGSENVELYIHNLSPSDTEEGVAVYAGEPGITIILTNGDNIYAKTEGAHAVSTLVCVY